MVLKSVTRSVLIIDDDAFDSSIIKNCILSCESDIAVFEEHDSTIAVFKFLEIEPDLTLIDISMPHLDGFRVLEKLAPIVKATPSRVIMLSGSTNAYDRLKSLQLGADDYKVKPSEMASYRNLAKELLYTL
ncbi:response regulator transcription factor [Ahrensia kielensis]|uniref:response regulator transcription factor n=1 Tax=Ahrensia kielensis TaxID=76980 RepID=UPI0003612F7C|nr:response regulator [Ahrensia kielensis]